jgi:hypothetical protein
LNNTLKEYGFNFEFPKKKILGNTNPIFMAQRQNELQVYFNINFSKKITIIRTI